MLSKDSGAVTAESQSEEFLRILAQTLESEVSILDADMNYLFMSDSVYKTIQCDPSELQPGDSLKKCHEIMLRKGLLNEDILTQQHLSSEEQAVSYTHLTLPTIA